ncbi:MAG TPA: DNA-directed DNA polymerase, partial [archaeon]|nr:DNA-directed DNA polymerase [archaeon]
MTNPVTLEVCIIGSDYVMEDGKPVIHLWGKTKKGETVLILDKVFRPYFYVETRQGFEVAKALPDGMGWIVPEKVETVEKKLYGKQKNVVKVVLTSPTDVPRFKSGLERADSVRATYEYNIAYYKRYLIDKGVVPLNWIMVNGKGLETLPHTDFVVELEGLSQLPQTDYPKTKVLTFDTEVMETDGEKRVVIVSFNSNYGFKKNLVVGRLEKKNVECFEDERGLLERFIQILKGGEYDIICGYNTDGFDFPLLFERVKKHNLKFDVGFQGREPIFVMKGAISSFAIPGKIHIDLYNFVENIVSQNLATEVLSLNRVAKELVGEGKKRVEWIELKQAWESGDKGKLVDHCEKDAELTIKLANVLVPQIFELSRVAGQIPFDTSRMTYSQLVEWLFIRKSHIVGELVPNRPSYEEIKVRQLTQAYVGGYVYTPKSGLHHNIALFDFKSLYPSIIISHNISPETLNCGCCSTPEDRNVISKDKNRVPEESYYFCINHKGFIPEVIENLLAKRIEINKELKILDRDSPQYKELYNRQHALKILANASYGYFGYPGSRWFSTICAKSITAWGRHYIKKVIELAEKEYKVIYGDTDSVFVNIEKEADVYRF